MILMALVTRCVLFLLTQDDNVNSNGGNCSRVSAVNNEMVVVTAMVAATQERWVVSKCESWCCWWSDISGDRGNGGFGTIITFVLRCLGLHGVCSSHILSPSSVCVCHKEERVRQISHALRFLPSRSCTSE